MKIRLCHLALIAAATLIVSPNWAIGADTVPPAKATPGSPAETDSKTQENNPSGPTDQTTDHPKEGTKKKKKKTDAPVDAGKDQSGDTATKTPQKDTPPSTPKP